MMDELKEYVVTAKTMEAADSLLDDMETVGGELYIPNRAVEVAQRREISRNTHFMLSDAEASQLRNDFRVIAVEQLPSQRGLEPISHWTQLGDFNKSSVISVNDKNWGLHRVAAGSPLSGWGTNGSVTRTTQAVTTTSSGKNVDIVVVDSHINFNHPEFSINVDGTGGSRAVQYDWFKHSAELGYSTSGAYQYAGTPSSNHGTHTAGTCAGNTQGWARDANVYNIEFIYNGTNQPAGDWTLLLFDYIRQFHKTKTINRAIGRRNPTISNNSWGYNQGDPLLANLTSVTYRGLTTALSGSDAAKKITLEANGVPVPFSTRLHRVPVRVAAVDADVEDAIADGIIFVASAGNSFWNTVLLSSTDYDNRVIASGQQYLHSRGSSPNSNSAISVGNIGPFVQEYKSSSSNYGDKVTIYAPGTNIVSAVYDSTAAAEFGITLVNDARNSAYKMGSISGTSMSGPQVTGVLACLLEQQPMLTQADALAYIIATSTKSQIGSTGGAAGDYTSLGTASNNRYLFCKLERPITGNTTASNTYKLRPTTGSVYPRVQLRRTLSIITAAVPGAPDIVTASAAGPTAVILSFNAPVNNNGAVITSYTATSNPGNIVGTVNQAGSGTITISGLVSNTSYTFTVTAANSIGTGTSSSASNTVTTAAIASPGGTVFVFRNVGFNYSVDTINGGFPTLTLIRGQTYTFDLVGITSSHPWALRLASNNLDNVPGTTGNNANGGVSGPATVTYAVPLNAPAALCYQCVIHSGMIGIINTVN